MSVSPCATIEARITNAATSKTSVRSGAEQGVEQPAAGEGESGICRGADDALGGQLAGGADGAALRLAGEGAAGAREDLEQAAYAGLIKAIRRFEPERGAAFASFAVPTILGELRRTCASASTRTRGLPLILPDER